MMQQLSVIFLLLLFHLKDCGEFTPPSPGVEIPEGRLLGKKSWVPSWDIVDRLGG